MEFGKEFKHLQMTHGIQRRTLLSSVKKKDNNSDDDNNVIQSRSPSPRIYDIEAQSPRRLPSVLKKTVPHSPCLMILDEGNRLSEDSRKSEGSPRKMHVHFSNTLEVVHDIRDSSTEDSPSSYDSKPTPSEYSSDFEKTESNTEKSSYGKYSSDFDSSTLSGKYVSDFETLSDNSQTDQETSDLATFSELTDNSDSTRTYSDSDSYTESLYSDISSLERDSSLSGDVFTDTFESLPYTSETSKTSLRHSILDSLAFPDLSDIEASEVSSTQSQFIADTLYRLKHEHIKLDLDLPDIQLPSQPAVDKKESKHLASYCRMKIKQLQQNRDSDYLFLGRRAEIKVERRRAEIKVKRKPTRVEEYGIGSSIVERIKLHNLMANMKKKCEEEIHDVKTCQKCRVKLEELDGQQLKTDFLRKNCQKIQSDIIDDKIQNHLIKMEEE
ncbi:hypothetical protein LOTGIDRAFT_174395 [Lottia gigantea]|uniref:Uncharacterized protein n=1 Tax=Lottia gigantea TaxID=225164 RepID=V4A2H7_LOTGI|nr:hypothetical protein LOTGIDRAFT_174395 [Lottia gigantea]ESO98068.1 hypothetical protein LOTGIDRAFT_174395 [Lottia gigantea]